MLSQQDIIHWAQYLANPEGEWSPDIPEQVFIKLDEVVGEFKHPLLPYPQVRSIAAYRMVVEFAANYFILEPHPPAAQELQNRFLVEVGDAERRIVKSGNPHEIGQTKVHISTCLRLLAQLEPDIVTHGGVHG